MRHASKSITLIVFLLAAACGVTPTHMPDGGAGGSGPKPATVSEATCERLDACNALPGSVEECIQETNTDLNALPQNQRAEVELALKQCLAHPSCDGLVECLASIFQ